MLSYELDKIQLLGDRMATKHKRYFSVVQKDVNRGGVGRMDKRFQDRKLCVDFGSKDALKRRRILSKGVLKERLVKEG